MTTIRAATPTFHERMIWGQGDAAGLKVVDTAVGKVGALACWEHYNPLARYALMTQHEQVHCAQFPGSLVGPIFADQIEVTIRHHALEAGCFVINSTGWLSEAQIAAITPDAGLQKALRGGCNTAIISPEGVHLAPPLREGEGMVIADLDMALIAKRKRMMMTELQSHGLRLLEPNSPNAGVASRCGGAGPSDHKAVTVDGHTIMVPVHTSSAWNSPFVAKAPDAHGRSALMRGSIPIAQIAFPRAPRFYALQTMDGVPYSHIATLHGSDVLATTVAFRHHGRLGATLIRLAVSSAHARGCRLFLAHVQSQNTPLFKKLHWQVLKHETVHGRPHDLMQADLAHYPPCHDPLWGFAACAKAAA